MKALRFKTVRVWIRCLFVTTLSLALAGCDSNPGGPSAPPKPSGSSEAVTDTSAAPKGTASAKTKKRGVRVATPPVARVE
jgi:hypothetical protein